MCSGRPAILLCSPSRSTAALPRISAASCAWAPDPATSAFDVFCPTHDHANLFVVDTAFRPTSAAVNPSLTIAAQALRVAVHILQAVIRRSS
jgi:choline dehydrogenase-like flavoprotein